MRAMIINYKLNMTTREYEQIGETVAPQIASVPGLIHKTWIWDEETQEAGGIYVFADQESLDEYLRGPIISQLKAMPQASNIRIQQFDVLERASAVTRGVPEAVSTPLPG